MSAAVEKPGKIASSAVIAEGEFVSIPRWVVDHASFRRWATSDIYPDKGEFAYLDGQLWVDPSMERLWHNQIKTAITAVLFLLAKKLRLGMVLSDRMMLTNVDARLSTEPDGMFVSNESRSKERVEFAKSEDSLEAYGSPDMVLEVVSDSSVKKDLTLLKDLYHKAGIQESWFVDGRGRKAELQINRWTKERYVLAKPKSGWLKSSVFGRSFRLAVTPADGDLPEVDLQHRSA